ncbi:MAG: restriction endonuclease [Spirochaetaceae bacterium]|nr:restriction endonuclease [Spirochaetaceae bacterium]|tara:strand:+ start:7429 stop:11625 length:4197 start_codon:yes stop_codon:yes gene_type:complete
MSITRHHQEWTGLLEHSGPFLSIKLLQETFPQGLDALDSEVWAQTKISYEEWREATEGPEPDMAMHTAWIHFMLREVLELEQLLSEVPATFQVSHHQMGIKLKPDQILCADPARPGPENTSLLISTLPPRSGLERSGADERLSAVARMIYLQHALRVPLGLLTNGEKWTLVFAVPGETTGIVTWSASLWTEEKLTFRSFRQLLHLRQLVGAPAGQTTAELFEHSRDDQVDVTRQLGDQVRRAVEILIHTIDRINKDRNGELLQGFDEKRLYDAALTFMMRLVFLACAEERRILLPDVEEFQQNYGLFSLYDELENLSAQAGEEVLERRGDAYVRLLATFRAIHGGIRHPDYNLAAHGGSLFDPERYPFLEGRHSGQSVYEAKPLQIDNRTVLHLLKSLLYLQVKGAGGEIEARPISFRALSVEQIGHVYEGLLDHTALRAEDTMLALEVNKDGIPNVELALLEKEQRKGEAALLKLLRDRTGKSENQLRRTMENSGAVEDHLLSASCENDPTLLSRVRPFAGLLQRDAFGLPLIMPKGSVYVGEGVDRRRTGTHYTPRSLTEPIVRHTLEPLVYEGPAEGRPPEEWTLKQPAEILSLKICDPAMGSGAFLVQACRYLAERLLESWKQYGAPKDALRTVPFGQEGEGFLDEEYLSSRAEEQKIQAMRTVVDRCIYGVDVNPMAVEMGKLSLWLETMQRNRPFSFLDHAMKCGDSLLGVDRSYLEQLVAGRKESEQHYWYDDTLMRKLAEAAAKRKKLEALDDTDIAVIHKKEKLLQEAEKLSDELEEVALYITGGLLAGAKPETLLERGAATLAEVKDVNFGSYVKAARAKAAFIWFAEFPEVFDAGGFHALVGNPPFMGGQKLTGNFSMEYRNYLVEYIARGKRGSADLSSYFFLRAFDLLREPGQFGLLATNTIAQGDTREVGLDQVTEWGGKIYRANPTRPWPGQAGVHVAAVWLRKGAWKSGAVLENEELEEHSVPALTPYLTPPGEVVGNPYPLKENAGLSFQGSNVLGMGFVMEPEEAHALIEANKRNADVLKPYLNGDDLNSRPDQSPSRWVINFYDWPLERSAGGSWYDGLAEKPEEKQKEPGFTFYEDPEGLPSALKKKRKAWLREGKVPSDYPYLVAADYPDCLRIVEEKVKPDREKLFANGNPTATDRARKWWRYGRMSAALYGKIRGMERVVVKVLHSPAALFGLSHQAIVFSHALGVFALAPELGYCILNSSLHVEWAWTYGSTLGSSTLRYTPSDCFETFPFPEVENADVFVNMGAELAERLHAAGQRISGGITTVYNEIHDPSNESTETARIREHSRSIDLELIKHYGWTDLEIEHGFVEKRQGTRYSLAPQIWSEVHTRLLKLNHERHAQELEESAKQSAKSKTTKKRAAKKSKSDDSQGEMF